MKITDSGLKIKAARLYWSDAGILDGGVLAEEVKSTWEYVPKGETAPNPYAYTPNTLKAAFYFKM